MLTLGSAPEMPNRSKPSRLRHAHHYACAKHLNQDLGVDLAHTPFSWRSWCEHVTPLFDRDGFGTSGLLRDVWEDLGICWAEKGT